MTVTTYAQWLADGSPWKPSAPAAAMAAHCRAHGVEYGIIGAVDTHLDVSFPEDHAPYSRTPWPGAQPYPYVLAVDLMTTDPAVARRLMAAKRIGALPCLKYINWTDEHGDCWHTSWQPDEAVRTSTDRGHIHLSFRTDHTTCGHAFAVDPFAAGGTDMDQAEQLIHPTPNAPGRTIGAVFTDLDALRDYLIGADTVAHGPVPGDASWPKPDSPLAKLLGLPAQLAAVALDAKAAASLPTVVTMTPEDRAAIIAGVVAGLAPLIPTAEQNAIATLDEQHRRDAA